MDFGEASGRLLLVINKRVYAIKSHGTCLTSTQFYPTAMFYLKNLKMLICVGFCMGCTRSGQAGVPVKNNACLHHGKHPLYSTHSTSAVSLYGVKGNVLRDWLADI